MNLRPCIAITVGDPAGIGPEIAKKAIADPRVREVCEPVLYGPHTEAQLKAFAPGTLSADAGRAAYDAIVAAVGDAMAGNVAAIATAPINKEAFARAGLKWRAHTAERLRDTIELTAEWLPRFGVGQPRLALAGLNPHAGEHGVIGGEERSTLEPVAAECRAAGLDITGPL